MQMRPSRVLRKLRAGQIASCVKINLTDSRIIEIAAMCGFDCVWLGVEHTPTDWSVLESHIRAAKIYDMDSVVQVTRGSYSDYIRPLEADATGIMVPHLMSLEDAKEVVQYTKFHPLGRRPIDGGNADGAYCMVDINDYVKTANQERFVIGQIEDPEVLDDLDQIAKLKGLDMLFFGANDFSHALGRPGQMDDPCINDIRRRIGEAIQVNNKFGFASARPDNIPELIKMGYRFLSVGADVLGLSSYFKKTLEQFGEGIEIRS